MASEKQSSANCANAERSTGPKTAAGRFSSSRNAFRHGLSAQLQRDPTVTERVDAMAGVLVGASDNAERQLAATEWSQELLRVRAVRARLLQSWIWRPVRNCNAWPRETARSDAPTRTDHPEQARHLRGWGDRLSAIGKPLAFRPSLILSMPANFTARFCRTRSDMDAGRRACHTNCLPCTLRRPHHRDMVTTHRTKRRMKSYCNSSDLLGSHLQLPGRRGELGCRFVQVFC